VTKRQQEDYFLAFKAHTILKHLIFDRYLKAWSGILLRKWERVWIVDAFAGTGGDNEGRDGSPVIAAKIAVAVQRRLGSGKQVRVVAIEKDLDRFETLVGNMARYDADRGGENPVAILYHATLADVIDTLLTDVAKEPAFFFLDPFGVDGLRRDVVAKILARPHAEVLVLFSDESAVRLLGVIAADVPSVEAEVSKVRARPSLFPEFDSEDEARRKAEVEASIHALEYTKPAAERILLEAFGTDAAQQELSRMPISRRPRRAVEMYIDLLRACGAGAVIPFSVRDRGNRHAYYLLHASKAGAAVKAMKEALQAAINASALPENAKESMILHITKEVAPIVEVVGEHFAGRTVRWQGSADTVREFALRDTDYFPHMADALKTALRGYVTLERPLTFTFPGA
jgi:three-Cys-motif partner protein